MENETYSTTDFYTTAVLISQGFLIQKVTTEKPGGRVKRFHFEKSQALDEIIMDYMNRQLEGNIRDFRDAIEISKDLIFQS